MYLCVSLSSPKKSRTTQITEASSESQQEIEKDAQDFDSALSITSRTESKLREDYSKSFTLGSSVYGPWSLSSMSVDSQELEVRAAQVYNWEAGILESKNRTIQPKQEPVPQADTPGTVKTAIIKDVQETTEKLSEIFVRPHWSNKVEYIMAQVGYSLKPLHLWHFPFLWLHHGNGKSGD